MLLINSEHKLEIYYFDFFLSVIANIFVHLHVVRVIPPIRLILFVCFVCLMGFNTTFNNISVILWRSVLLLEETGVPGENHRPASGDGH